VTIRSAFFDSVSGDRIYTSDSFAQVFNKSFTDGVIQGYANELAVSNPSGLNISVNTGAAWVQGRLFEQFGGTTALTMAASNPSFARIDTVVVRLDYTNRLMSLAILTGTASASPVAPTLTQNTSTWEVAIANLTIFAAASNPGTITQTLTRSFVRGFLSPVTSFPTIVSPDEVVYRSDLQSLYAGTNQINIPTFSGSFPASPPTGMRVFRADRNKEYFWNGTNWLTTQLFVEPLSYLTPGLTVNQFSATVANAAIGSHPDNVSDLYVEALNCVVFVVTTNNGSNFWTVTYRIRNSSATQTSTGSVTTAAATAGVQANLQLITNTVISRSNFYDIFLDIAKTTGTPGNLSLGVPKLVYRLVG
jgi:hypothetical protein